MKASEAIKKIQDIIRKHGDCDVYTFGNEFQLAEDDDFIEYKEDIDIYTLTDAVAGRYSTEIKKGIVIA